MFLILRLGIVAGDPGPFCLGRGGIYCREVGAWIVFLVFKGNDMHSGFAPTEDVAMFFTRPALPQTEMRV